MADDADHDPVAAGQVVELDIRRVRRRSSREARSMTLVVRSVFQWAAGGKKPSNSSKSHSTESERVPLLPRSGAGVHRWRGWQQKRA